MALIEQLNQLIEPAVDAVGYEFLGLEFIPQGRQSVLRIFIDHEQGITVDDCATVSRQVSSVLDVEDPITTHYNLEVSSPGYDRPLFKLAHFNQFVGSEIKLRTHTPVDERRNFRGWLTQVENEMLTLEVDGATYQVAFGNVDKANLVPVYDDGAPSKGEVE